MSFKRIASILLVLILSVGLFVGCGSDSDGDGDTASNGGTSIDGDIFFTGKIDFKDSNGESVYSILRPEGDSTALPVAQKVFKAIKDTVGVSAKNQTDDNDGTDKYEILIGNCDRPETATAKQYLAEKVGGRYDDVIICSINKKIVIYSKNPLNLEKAAEYFVNTYVKADGVSGGILYTEAAKGNFESVTVNGEPIGKFKLIRPHFNSSYLTEMAMEEIVDTVYKKTGFMLDIVHDEYVNTGDYEIIVGKANRSDIKTIADTDAYNITVSGKKVYLNGGSAHATAVAVSEFSKLLTGDIKDQSTDGSYNTVIGSYNAATTLKYAWGDDFNGTSLDTSKWYQSTMKESGTKGENGKTSVRSDYPNDVFVNDGSFHICARQDETYYYGGRITTQKTMRYKYGYLEMSAVLPHGSDFWVALWACGDVTEAINGNYNMYPEIDVIECFGNSAWYAANCHSWPTVHGEVAGLKHTSLDDSYGNEKKYQCPDDLLLTQSFHTYGMMWTPDSMTFVCDGDDYFNYNFQDGTEDKNTFNQEMYLIISMALGFENNSTSINDATPDDWAYTNKYIVDWINIYQKNDGISYVKNLG